MLTDESQPWISKLNSDETDYKPIFWNKSYQWKTTKISLILNPENKATYMNNLFQVLFELRVWIMKLTKISCKQITCCFRWCTGWASGDLKIDSLVQDCSISIANALEILQSSSKPSKLSRGSNYINGGLTLFTSSVISSCVANQLFLRSHVDFFIYTSTNIELPTIYRH